MGPNQGQGVPAPEASEGLMYDLYPYNISVPIGGSWNGTVPGWNAVQDTVKLQAVRKVEGWILILLAHA